jgi:hypothetical protein
MCSGTTFNFSPLATYNVMTALREAYERTGAPRYLDALVTHTIESGSNTLNWRPTPMQATSLLSISPLSQVIGLGAAKACTLSLSNPGTQPQQYALTLNDLPADGTVTASVPPAPGVYTFTVRGASGAAAARSTPPYRAAGMLPPRARRAWEASARCLRRQFNNLSMPALHSHTAMKQSASRQSQARYAYPYRLYFMLVRRRS